MIDRTHALPVSQQARLDGIARSSANDRSQPVSETDLLLMRRIDELHMEFPFAGAGLLARLLRQEGPEVGRRRVRTLMKRRGGAVLQSEHKPPQRAAQDLAILAAWHEERAGQPGVRPRHHLHSDGARLRVPDGGWWTRRTTRFSRTGLPSRWKTRMPSRHWKKRSPARGCPTS